MIFINWSVWIYALTYDRIIDASFGYFIISYNKYFSWFIFLQERLNFKRKISIFIILFSISYMIFFYKSTPFIGLIVALSSFFIIPY